MTSCTPWCHHRPLLPESPFYSLMIDWSVIFCSSWHLTPFHHTTSSLLIIIMLYIPISHILIILIPLYYCLFHIPAMYMLHAAAFQWTPVPRNPASFSSLGFPASRLRSSVRTFPNPFSSFITLFSPSTASNKFPYLDIAACNLRWRPPLRKAFPLHFMVSHSTRNGSI